MTLFGAVFVTCIIEFAMKFYFQYMVEKPFDKIGDSWSSSVSERNPTTLNEGGSREIIVGFEVSSGRSRIAYEPPTDSDFSTGDIRP